ncbi:MAG TPA: glycosyltransferase family 4 protein [Nocardioidaceae bacterium]|nr:glycosyltransferase family 4 protein [Nocardioidaceae bacterium]
MKIYFLMHTVFGPGGGVLTVVRNLAADLASRHEVEIVSAVRFREEPVHPFPDNVKIRSLVDTRTGRLPRRERKELEEALSAPSTLMPSNEPHRRTYSQATDRALREFMDSVTDGALVGMQPGMNLAVARLGRPEVVKVGEDHRPFEIRHGDLREAMIRELPRLDAFVVLTEDDARQYREVLDPGLRIEVMPNATPAYTGRLSTLENKVVTAGGHLRPKKGFDRLVEAWALVAEQYPDWEVRIFGSGPQEAALERQIDELGLGGKVRLMGYSTRLREEVAESSVFVCSSRIEGYGMVLVEAMSCGVPVVSFDAPSGPASIIHHGVDGYLVPNHDIPALARQIIEVIEMGPDGRRRLAEAGLKNAAERTQPAISARWEQLLTELQEAKRT